MRGFLPPPADALLACPATCSPACCGDVQVAVSSTIATAHEPSQHPTCCQSRMPLDVGAKEFSKSHNILQAL